MSRMETFWLVVVIVVMSVMTLVGWFRFIDHDGRVPRKPRRVDLSEDEDSD